MAPGNWSELVLSQYTVRASLTNWSISSCMEAMWLVSLSRTPARVALFREFLDPLDFFA